MAILYNIPVITATQLNRTAYRVENAKELGADQLGESIKKVEHSDMVMVLHKVTKNGKDKVIAKIAKFRSNRSGYAIEANTDFEKYKFHDFTLIKNEDKKDNVQNRTGNDSVIPMDGCQAMMATEIPEKHRNSKLGLGKPEDVKW
jgi:DNA modification methylase